MVDGCVAKTAAEMEWTEYAVVGRSGGECVGGGYDFGDESVEEIVGLSGSIFSIASSVRAGDTGRLPGIGSRAVPTTPLARREELLFE
jgi:hypothetical protein